MLCSNCDRLGIGLWFPSDQDVAFEAQDYSEAYFWHENAEVLCFQLSENISSLQDQATNGCRLCTIISQAISHIPVAREEDARKLPIILYSIEPAEFVVALDSDKEGLLKLCTLDVSRKAVKFPSTSGTARHSNLTTDCVTAKSKRPENDHKGICDMVHNNPASEHCIDLAKQWLQDCKKSHGDCANSGVFISNSVTRFIHIGDSSKVSLVEFGPNEAPSEWIALSYRWGCDQKITLTQATILDLERGVQSQDLDDTIQDAIFVAHGLCIEYIWVDALCIFQDQSQSDWNVQSTNMQQIYEQSTLTLVSIDTTTVQEKFLTKRTEQYIPVKWLLNCPRADPENPNVVYLSKHWDPVRDNLRGPWSTRGWTFQESLLPNRLLYYTATQMVWKCCKTMMYERGVTYDHKEKIYDEFEHEGGENFWSFDLFTKMKLMIWFKKNLTHDIQRKKHRLWYELVEEYSTRLLTNFSDRCNAISSLVEKYQSLLGDDRYLAGLWENDMVRGLLWYEEDAKIFGPIQPGIHRNPFCEYPSWSWLHTAPGLRVKNDHAFNPDIKYLAHVQCIHIDEEHRLQNLSGHKSPALRLSGITLFFDKLYYEDWRSSTTLSAFERHISQLVEEEYGNSAKEMTLRSKFAAVLMLRHFPSIDRRVDVLVLEAVGDSSNSSIFQRRGVVTLRSFPSHGKLFRRPDSHQRLSRRLGLNSGPGRVKYCSAQAVFEEVAAPLWMKQDLIVV